MVYIGLSMLTAAFLPLKLWSQAFTVVITVINVLPTDNFKNQGTKFIHLFITGQNSTK